MSRVFAVFLLLAIAADGLTLGLGAAVAHRRSSAASMMFGGGGGKDGDGAPGRSRNCPLSAMPKR